MNAFLFLAAFFSEVIGTVAGFGSSTVFLPLALFFFDFHNALVLVALIHIFGNISRVVFFRHGVDIKLLLSFGLASAIFSFLGALLVSYLHQGMLKGILGIFLTAYASMSLWQETIPVRASRQNAVIGGGVSGFIAGIIGTGGAIRGAFLSAFHLPKDKYIATAAAIAIAADLARVPVYVSKGFLSPHYYWSIPFLLAIAIGGAYIGKVIVKGFSNRMFRKVVLVGILIIGLLFASELLKSPAF